MSHSFHGADRGTYRKVAVVGTLFCVAFIAVSFYLRPQPDATYVLKKADKIVRTAASQRRRIDPS